MSVFFRIAAESLLLHIEQVKNDAFAKDTGTFSSIGRNKQLSLEKRTREGKFIRQMGDWLEDPETFYMAIKAKLGQGITITDTVIKEFLLSEVKQLEIDLYALIEKHDASAGDTPNAIARAKNIVNLTHSTCDTHRLLETDYDLDDPLSIFQMKALSYICIREADSQNEVYDQSTLSRLAQSLLPEFVLNALNLAPKKQSLAQQQLLLAKQLVQQIREGRAHDTGKGIINFIVLNTMFKNKALANESIHNLPVKIPIISSVLDFVTLGGIIHKSEGYLKDAMHEAARLLARCADTTDTEVEAERFNPFFKLCQLLLTQHFEEVIAESQTKDRSVGNYISSFFGRQRDEETSTAKQDLERGFIEDLNDMEAMPTPEATEEAILARIKKLEEALKPYLKKQGPGGSKDAIAHAQKIVEICKDFSKNLGVFNQILDMSDPMAIYQFHSLLYLCKREKISFQALGEKSVTSKISKALLKGYKQEALALTQTKQKVVHDNIARAALLLKMLRQGVPNYKGKMIAEIAAESVRDQNANICVDHVIGVDGARISVLFGAANFKMSKKPARGLLGKLMDSAIELITGTEEVDVQFQDVVVQPQEQPVRQVVQESEDHQQQGARLSLVS